MKIKPIMTEKSLEEAKNGRYTFAVPVNFKKGKIKETISDIFGVHVKTVRTMNTKPGQKTNIYRKKINVRAFKKAVVTLKDKEKIDIFNVDTEK